MCSKEPGIDMKNLIVVRHAKSSWKDTTLADHLRPLNKRGKRDAPEMGARLADRALQVDRIISSPAVRALTTAQMIARAAGYPGKEIVIDERLYPGDLASLMALIRELDEPLHTVMLFGHNPGLTDLVNTIGDDTIDNVPTCGVVEITLPIDRWKQTGRKGALAVRFDYPKKDRDPL